MALVGRVLGGLGDLPSGVREHRHTGALHQGTSGAIFRTTTQTDGTTLIVPVQALPFEGGEKPICIFSYLNFVFVGSNLGIRMCRTIEAYDPSGNAGDLEAGAIQPNLFSRSSGR